MTAIKIKQEKVSERESLLFIKKERKRELIIHQKRKKERAYYSKGEKRERESNTNYLIFTESTGIADSFKKLSAGCIFHHNSQMCGGQNHLQIVTNKQQN